MTYLEVLDLLVDGGRHVVDPPRHGRSHLTATSALHIALIKLTLTRERSGAEYTNTRAGLVGSDGLQTVRGKFVHLRAAIQFLLLEGPVLHKDQIKHSVSIYR